MNIAVNTICIQKNKATCRAVFTHGPKGPGPRAENFQGRHIKKKSRLKYGVRGKKGCPRERNLREIYTENTMLCLLSVCIPVIRPDNDFIFGRNM
jgi:hypothetical protein